MTAGSFTSSQSESLVTCVVPPGINAGGVEVFLRGVWTAVSASTGFPAPQLVGASPNVFQTSGGMLTLTGASFGGSACAGSGVSLLLTSTAAIQASYFQASSMQFVVPGTPSLVACAILYWSDTNVNCSVPAGLDPVVNVRVFVSAAVSSLPQQISYGAPAVTSVLPVDYLFSTSAGEVLTIIGTGFGPSSFPIAVLIGPPGSQTMLEMLSHTDTSISARLLFSRGGANLPVTVMTPLQARTAAGITVSFYPPLLLSMTPPGGRPVTGNFTFWCTGMNFAVTGLSINIGSTPCTSVSVLAGSAGVWNASCSSPAGFGTVPLVLALSGQQSTYDFAYDAPVVTSVSPFPADATVEVSLSFEIAAVIRFYCTGTSFGRRLSQG